MIRFASVLLVTLSSILSSDASASLLEGQTIAYIYYFPTNTTPYFADLDVTVGPGEEFANLYGDPNSGHGTVDISDKNITVDFFANGALTATDFHGFSIVDSDDTVAAFTSVVINPVTNLVGFTMSDISFDANNIYVNLEGLIFTTDSILSIDINGGNAPVPEPTTVLVWAGLGLAAAGSKRKGVRNGEKRCQERMSLG